MNCELAQEKIALAVYGELPDESVHNLEHHLAGCPTCSREYEATRALQQAMFLYPVEEPSPSLVAQARMKLEEALDAVPHRSWISQFVQSFSNGAARLQSAPVAASALLAFGLAMGGYTGFRIAVLNVPALNATLHPSGTPANVSSNQAGSRQEDASAQVANVSSIVREPGTENVEVRYNRLVPESIHGSLDDQRIRQLLLMAAQNQVNTGVRDDSVGLLAAECQAGHECISGPIRDTLMISLRYDPSPAVRLKALEGLQPYVSQDIRVRDAVLQALIGDKNAAVRTRAIRVLQPVEADSSVRQALHTVAAEDENPGIRNASQEVLSRLPDIQ